MPYIPKDRQRLLDEHDDAMESPGEFNYRVSCLADKYLRQRGLSYTTINALIGALECAKMELYRRIAVPYEEKKIIQNGDVYTEEFTQ